MRDNLIVSKTAAKAMISCCNLNRPFKLNYDSVLKMSVLTSTSTAYSRGTLNFFNDSKRDFVYTGHRSFPNSYNNYYFTDLATDMDFILMQK